MIRFRDVMWAAVVCGLVTSAAPAQTFDVVDIGVLPGTNVSYGRAINDAGVVAGVGGNNRLIQWSPTGGIRDLGIPNTVANLELRTNASGQIAGMWRRGGVTYPFLWNNGTFTELPQPAPGWVESVGRLTDGGKLLFRGPISSTGCPTQSSVYFGGALYPLSTVLGACWDARDIDDSPRVVGAMRTTTLFTTYDATSWAGGRTRGLPPGRGYFVPSTYQRLGPGGHLAGQQGNRASRLFVLGPDDDYFEADAPNGGSFFAAGVNVHGEVVANTTALPYLIRNKRLINLAGVVPGVTVIEVADINSRGHMVGFGLMANGEVHGIVVRPTDMPRTLRAVGTGNQITLSWAPAPSAPAGASYLLQVGSASGASNVFKANLGAVTTISGAVPNGNYFARVIMVYPNGAWSGVSDELQFSIPAAPPSPTGLTFSLSGRTVSLSWIAPAGAGGVEYVVEAGSSSGAADIFNGNVGPAPSITAPVPAGTYFIRVRATAGGTLSPPSNEVTVVVP